MTGEMSLYTSSMNSSESNNYRLRMYVDENYNPQGDGGNLTFAVKVNVYGKDRVGEEVSKVIIENLNSGSTYDDGYDTFITGEDPNNYVWYSGKLWRAVSVNNEDNTTKLVTQWNISGISFDDNSSTFEGSYMEEWLNDTSVDGFLGNLREPEKFIVMDAKWNATLDTTDLESITRPSDDGTIVEDAVGLLNIYEYQESFREASSGTGYLNNGLTWWTITPYTSTQHIRLIYKDGSETMPTTVTFSMGIRPAINLKSSVKVVDGNGTIDNPYRLEGDDDTNLSGTLLKDRYSGEYIKFGTEKNNLYRIVSHENGTGTKITSAEPLKDYETFKTSAFGDTGSYSSKNTIGAFLNEEYLINYVGDNYDNMIEDNTTWYLGTVGSGTSYKLAKYADNTSTSLTSSTTTAKIGLLRYGELMAGQFDKTGNNTNYWTLTLNNMTRMWCSINRGNMSQNNHTDTSGIRPSLNLKQNVVITSGDGTKNNPFTLELST